MINERAFLKLISGQSKGVIANVRRACLRIASLGYGGAMAVRNSLFDRRWLTIRTAAVPVISVGNLTTGGTGKTPVVALLSGLLDQHGTAPGIISRGYRSTDAGGNDEFQVLARCCPNVPHVQQPDRVAAARRLLQDHPHVRVIVMDDGFQHRRLHRDLDVMLIDATNPFGYDHLLPRGLLREPLSSLRRAGVVLLTRSDLASDADLVVIEQQVRRWTTAPVLRVEFRADGFVDAAGVRTPLAAMRDQPVFLMSGIGNPDAFESNCRRAGLSIVGHRWFADHHAYTVDELADVQRHAIAAGAVRIVVTLKDLVKLDYCAPTVPVGFTSQPATLPIAALEISARCSCDADAEVLRSLITASVD